jgi:hypothetical protein
MPPLEQDLPAYSESTDTARCVLIAMASLSHGELERWTLEDSWPALLWTVRYFG